MKGSLSFTGAVEPVQVRNCGASGTTDGAASPGDDAMSALERAGRFFLDRILH